MNSAFRASVLFIFTLAMAFAFQLRGTEALAQSSYFTSIGCVNCHAAPVMATCNGCHSHGTHPNSAKSSINVAGTTNKSTYAPGETVTVTMTGGYRTGWFRATLFDTDGVTELARSTGNDSGMGSSATYPAVLTAPAPTTPGTYTWVIAWYGNKYDASGAAFGTWVDDPNNQNTGTANAQHGWEKVNLPAFTVAAAVPSAPTISSVSPTSMVQGTTNSTLTINGTNLTGATVGFSGTGITTGVVTSSATSITVPVTVAATAMTGAQTLTVTTAGGSATSTFTVAAAPVPAPTITSVSPSSLMQGATNQTVTIVGTNLAGATVSFSNAGVTHGTATVTATSITLPVSVTAGATVGAGTISVTTANGSSAAPFTVTAAPVPAPTITSVAPNSLVQGAASQTVTINGTNLTGATVSFSNAGVTGGTAIVTAGAINLPVSVTAGATVGAGTVTVTTASGSASTPFSVTAAPVKAPTISSVMPGSLMQGASQTVTIAGTNLSGATVSFSNAGVTGGAATVTATSIALPVSVTAGAATGAGTVTVTTAGGSASTPFTVTASSSSAPVLTLSMMANGSYTNKVTLNVSGTATDPAGIKSVTVNGAAATVGANGSFSTAVSLVIGSNTVTVVATDNNNLQTTQTRTITYDPNAPVLTVATPADNSTATQASATVSGTVNESSTVTVSDNSGSPQSATVTGNSYTATVTLVAGVNTITITATDLAGNVSTVTRTVTYNNSSASTLALAVTSPDRDITTNQSSMVLKGTVTGGNGRVKVSVVMNGHTYTPAVRNGAFQQRLSFMQSRMERGKARKERKSDDGRLYTITVTARDAAGDSSTVTRNVIYNPKHSGGDD